MSRDYSYRTKRPCTWQEDLKQDHSTAKASYLNVNELWRCARSQIYVACLLVEDISTDQTATTTLWIFSRLFCHTSRITASPSLHFCGAIEKVPPFQPQVGWLLDGLTLTSRNLLKTWLFHCHIMHLWGSEICKSTFTLTFFYQTVNVLGQFVNYTPEAVDPPRDCCGVVLSKPECSPAGERKPRRSLEATMERNLCLASRLTVNNMHWQLNIAA